MPKHGGRKTHRVARLLNKYLSERNHGRVVIKLLGKIDHGICGILLVAGSRGSEEGAEGRHRGRVALFTSSSCVL